MGNNGSSNNTRESESRHSRRRRTTSNHDNRPPSTNESDDTLGGRRGYPKRSKHGSDSKLSDISDKDEVETEGILLSAVVNKSSRALKSKSILRPQSAPQKNSHLEDMLNENVRSSSSKYRNQDPSSAAQHKSHYHFKRRHNSQKGTNTEDDDDSSEEDEHEDEHQIIPISRPSVTKGQKNDLAFLTDSSERSQTFVRETSLDDQRITVEVKVTSLPKDGENEANNNSKISKDSQKKHKEHHHRKKSKEAAPASSADDSESASEESSDAETASVVTNGDQPQPADNHSDAPIDPTVSSKLLDSVKKDMGLRLAQEQRKSLMKIDPVLQLLDKANTNELILTNLPLSTTIADVHEVFHSAVGIRMGVESSKRDSKLAKMTFESKNDALDAYVLGKDKQINGQDVVFGIKREDPRRRRSNNNNNVSNDEDETELDEAEYPPSEKVDKDDLIRNWVKFQEETYEPSVQIKNKRPASSSDKHQQKKSK